MFKAVYQLKELGTFKTLAEAFKVIYDAIKDEKVLLWQMLETTIWIEHDSPEPFSFYEARDIMCAEGYLVDGKWIDKATPSDPQHGRDVKPLAQYLGEYIAVIDGDYVSDCDTWRELLKQALDAYESTEQVKIRIEPV